jgi:MFS family permease
LDTSQSLLEGWEVSDCANPRTAAMSSSTLAAEHASALDDARSGDGRDTSTTDGEDAALAAVQRRTVRVLVAAQLLGALGLAAGGTAGSLLAEQITGREAAAGLPLAVLVLGSGLAAVVVTRLMERTGRRVGLSIAHLGGAAGAAVVLAAAELRSWPLLLLGCGLLGAGNAAVMLARYAAADLSNHRGRAISVVVTAASVGAIAGPNLLGPAGSVAELAGLPASAGLFLLALPAFTGAALILQLFLRPDPLALAKAAVPTPRHAPRGLRTLLGDPHIRFALLVLGVANLAMVGMMSVSPVHMHLHGASLAVVGLVVGAHVGAMFLPSPLTGWLSDIAGGRAVAALGAALLVGAGGVAVVAGTRPAGVVVALLLLGVGWNAGLIGGSSLLRDTRVDPALRTRAEGLGELGMGTAAAVGGSGAGPLLALGGFTLVGLVALLPCVLLLAVFAFQRAIPRKGSRGRSLMA